MLEQAFELPLVQADRMLAVSRFLAGHMPVGHPAELLAFVGLEHNEKGIERDLFLLFSQPGFKFLRQQCLDYFVLAVACAERKSLE